MIGGMQRMESEGDRIEVVWWEEEGGCMEPGECKCSVSEKEKREMKQRDHFEVFRGFRVCMHACVFVYGDIGVEVWLWRLQFTRGRRGSECVER